MQFIKTYWGEPRNYRVSIRTNTYCRSLAHIQKMLEVLKKDHPEQEITADNATVVIYNTRSFKGIMGIEFSTKHPNKTYLEYNVAPCIF